MKLLKLDTIDKHIVLSGKAKEFRSNGLGDFFSSTTPRELPTHSAILDECGVDHVA